MEKQLKQLFGQIDRAVDVVAAKFPEEFKCRKGCSDCCNAAFDISFPEAWVIRKYFAILGRKTRRNALRRAKEAQRIWNRALSENSDMSRLRIPCPLLNRDEQCLLYEVRPVNCRTYGVPTEIGGRGHVCSLSGFKSGKTYPTIRLNLIQQELLRIGQEKDPELFRKRWPISAVLLNGIS